MRRKVDKRRWIFAGFNLLLVVLAAVCGILFGRLSRQLTSLDAADAWRGSSEMAFAQVGCFLPVDQTKQETDIFQFRQTLEQKLTEESLIAPEGGRLYADAYSAEARLTVTGDHGSAEVPVIGVGGDFFLFHPLQLRSGSYLSGDDLMQDRVVLDETLAWTLFGSPDVTGMTVKVGEVPLQVAGVIRREQDYASRAAYPENTGMFLSWSAFSALTEQGITCYEIVLPNLISGYGLGLVRDNFPVGRGDLVENSVRYSLKSLLQVVKDFGRRSMRTNGVIYPYWENAVRMTEDHLALLLVLMIWLLLCPVVSLTVAVIRAIVRTGNYVQKRIPETADKLVQQKREERYKRQKNASP